MLYLLVFPNLGRTSSQRTYNLLKVFHTLPISIYSVLNSTCHFSEITNTYINRTYSRRENNFYLATIRIYKTFKKKIGLFVKVDNTKVNFFYDYLRTLGYGNI